jgi:hypothetical protein
LVQQVLVRELPMGSVFTTTKDAGTESPQPERVFRVVEIRKSTAIVENGIGVRTSMSKKTTVLPSSQEVWASLARPDIAAPFVAAPSEKKVAS